MSDPHGMQIPRAVAGRGPYVLILSPTRELALQIAAVMEEAGAPSGLKTLCAYGGVPKPPQVWTPDLGLLGSTWGLTPGGKGGGRWVAEGQGGGGGGGGVLSRRTLSARNAGG